MQIIHIKALRINFELKYYVRTQIFVTTNTVKYLRGEERKALIERINKRKLNKTKKVNRKIKIKKIAKEEKSEQ